MVDDNFGVRTLLCEFLLQEGFNVKEATNGLDAIQLVMQEKPRMVLLDMRMPGLTGMETFAKIRDLAPKTIVVSISAYKTKDCDVQEGQIKHHIVKPFDLDQVRDLLHDLLSDLHNSKSA